jgi:transcriptional regulator with XRE-family HTH domain
MSNNYDEFLRRMIAYREKRKLTQNDVSRYFGKDQSQFSKMELGKTVVSYEVLECLQNRDWDVDYIITGKEKIQIESSIADYLKEKMGSNWKQLDDALFWIIGHELREKGNFVSEDAGCEYALLKLFIQDNPPATALLAVRNVLGISQFAMSDKMGVNIKKYCQLEKGEKMPDAELLGMIYELAYCRPGIFLTGNVPEYLLDCLWNRIKSKKQKEAKDFLDYTIRIYKA